MNLNQCIFCDATTDLNTSLTITLEDGSKVAVRICDVHAEDATVKSAREAYLEKRKKIDELLAQARSLGLQLSESPSGLVVATQKPEPRVMQVQPTAEAAEALEGPNVVSTSKLDGRKFQSVGGTADGVAVSSHAPLDTSSLIDQLPEGALDGQAEMTVVEGRGGQPLAIPQRRIDKTGTTRISIKKSTDAALQDRFKKMAADTMGDRTPDFARSGYQNTQRPCPLCKGACVVKQGRQEVPCPKCNGSGIISIY